MDISTLENERRRAIQQQGDLRMGVSGGWNVAGDMRSSPYAPFEPYDDGYDDIESYRGQPVFGVEEGGQMFFDFPFVQAPPRENNMMIAKLPHTPPREKMLVGNRFMDSPLRFKSEEQRAQELEDYSKNFIYRGN